MNIVYASAGQRMNVVTWCDGNQRGVTGVPKKTGVNHQALHGMMS